MKRTFVTALAAVAGLVLAACGGGGCNPCDAQPTVPTPHVDCSASGVCR